MFFPFSRHPESSPNHSPHSLTDSVLISVGEEVVDADGDVVVLEVVHEVCAVAAHLHV